MKFSEEEVFPGAKVKLSLKASPGSMFAISAVDKSVHFMGNANDISRGGVSDTDIEDSLNSLMFSFVDSGWFCALIPTSQNYY